MASAVRESLRETSAEAATVYRMISIARSALFTSVWVISL